MSIFSFLIYLSACTIASPPPELDEVGRAVSTTWRAGGPTRNLRVLSRVELKIERDDEALDDRYFPTISLGPGASSTAGRPVVATTRRWVEDVATRGLKYRNDYELLSPDGRPTPPGWNVQEFFNGTTSWTYEPLNASATQYVGADRLTRLRLGYYQDMIGFPGDPLERDRTTAGGSGQLYQLDRLIPSGMYRIDGEELIEDRPCLVISRPGLDRLWLREDRGWAIARREWRWSIGGPLKRRFLHRDFREIIPGAWIPHEATMEIFGSPASRPGQRVAVLKATVVQAEADISDDWFEPHFPVGTSVTERETGNRYPFGVELRSIDKAVAAAARYGPAFQPAPWWQRPGWMRIPALLALAAGAAWGIRVWLVRRGEASR